MNEPALLARNLEVRAAGRTILELDSLTVNAGEFVAVFGPNGAGKTTLLKAAVGLLRPARGEVRVLGQAPAALSPLAVARLRRRIGYLPQPLSAPTPAPLTVREIVAIGRTGLAGLLRPLSRADWRRVDDALARLDLAPLRDACYADLSGGEQRRTLLARVLAQAPELLLLDEPAANLDVGGREELVATLDSLHRELGLATLLVCHELEVIPPACRRVLVLDAGRCAADGPPEDALTAAQLEDLFGVRLSVLHGAGRHAVAPCGTQRP
jgi:ABC-type cobalamin/Fe3+-siderophores transport system ATPase subunit